MPCNQFGMVRLHTLLNQGILELKGGRGREWGEVNRLSSSRNGTLTTDIVALLCHCHAKEED